MPGALGRAARADRRADCRSHPAAPGTRTGTRPRRIPRPPPAPAPRPRSHRPPGRPLGRHALDAVALVAAPLPVLPHSRASSAAPVRPHRAAPRRPVPPGNAVGRPAVEQPRPAAGVPPVGFLQPRGGRFAFARGPVRLRRSAGRRQDSARTGTRAGGDPLRRARGAHGHRLRRHVADAVHRCRRIVEAEIALPAPDRLVRRHPHRTGAGRCGDPGLGADRPRLAAHRLSLPGDDQLGTDPGAECQPLHALRRLFHPFRPARLPQPARALVGTGAHRAAPQPARPRRPMAGEIPGAPASPAGRLCASQRGVTGW
jgi:hypothetical protein